VIHRSFFIICILYICAFSDLALDRGEAQTGDPMGGKSLYSAQTSGDEYSVYGATQILKKVFSITGEYFHCDPVGAVFVGEQIPVLYSRDYKTGWTVRRDTVPVGATDRSFPFMGILETPDSTIHSLYLSRLVASKAIPRGEVLDDSTYHILANRDIAKGEILGAYMVGHSLILALEMVSDQALIAPEVPVLIISKQPIPSVQIANSPWMYLWIKARAAAKANSGR